MTATEPIADEVDQVQFLDSGRIRFAFAGTVVTCREVKWAELEDLKGSYYDLIDSAQAAAAGSLRDRNAKLDAATIKWLREAMTKLGDTKLPAVAKFSAQIPGSWVSLNYLSTIVAHWQTYPLPRGVTVP